MAAKNWSKQQIYWIEKWKNDTKFFDSLSETQQRTINNCLTKSMYGGTSVSSILNQIREKWVTADSKAEELSLKKSLFEEAKKRGVHIGDIQYIEGLNGTFHASFPIEKIVFDSKKKSLETDLGCILWKNGKWAKENFRTNE